MGTVPGCSSEGDGVIPFPMAAGGMESPVPCLPYHTCPGSGWEPAAQGTSPFT